jgi:hypothetical protein
VAADIKQPGRLIFDTLNDNITDVGSDSALLKVALWQFLNLCWARGFHALVLGHLKRAKDAMRLSSLALAMVKALVKIVEGWIWIKAGSAT